METEILVGGIPLMAVILGVVEFLKQFGVTGKGSIAANAILSIVLGLGYRMSIKPPQTFAEWFETIIFCLALCLTSGGIYDLVRRPKQQP